MSPRVKRNIFRIIPYGVIWILTGWVFLLSEELFVGDQEINSAIDIQLTLPVFIFATISIFLLGVQVGIIETLLLQKRFLAFSFLRKIFFKFLIYMAIMTFAICITYPTAVVIELGTSFADHQVWSKTRQFLLSPMFFNALLQLSFSLFLCLIYSAVSENLGHSVLLSFFTGKYHRPVVEERIFMFLDMKNSTSIAEKLGHVRYFKLLGEYYDLMSGPIIDHQGEVYQYIGDEVVITWKAEMGLTRNNCVNCFFAIKKDLKRREESFMNKYGVLPDFKAGLHIGEVTTGEIGALKKEIVFVGDVLNTTARIQSMCKEYQKDLILSDTIYASLGNPSEFKIQQLGELQLKGKLQATGLFGIE